MTLRMHCRPRAYVSSPILVRFPVVQRCRCGLDKFYSSSKSDDTSTIAPVTDAEEPEPKRKLTQAEADANLMAAYREKFGGDTTATFEDGKPSEMGRAVRNNMFRYI